MSIWPYHSRNSMDQSKDILELRHFKIDLDQVPYIGKGNERTKKLARRRWAILAKALKSPTGSQPTTPTDEISVRRISSFMLLETRKLPQIQSFSIIPNEQISKRTWYEYSINVADEIYTLNIGHRNRTFSAEDLMGFNNTGNVCIWPSEETLSYYVCSNLQMFRNRTVLELGGGMSCLAGLYVAKYGEATRVLVTDGNKTSMENVQAILKCNTFVCNTDCAILKWGDISCEGFNQFDVILSADCLFFDDARVDFINCVYHHLSSKGVALVMAPQRGTTLNSFILQSECRGLRCKRITNYSDVVWRKRLDLMENSDYNDNIHYPILIEVTKVADYWKSQDRKYCDFCKCWITDNKPSRDFHENGRRHKENVKKRLKTITRNSAKAAKETEKADATIRAMEVAAMDAYRRDVQDSSASDLTSIAIRKRLADGNLEIAGGSSQKVWHEAVAKDGKSYFWNTMTNETQWSAPREGYYSIMQQKADQEREAQKKGKQIARKQQREELMAAQARREEEQEERARQEREKLKIRRVKEDTPPPTYGPIIEPGKTDPYGKWQTVQISVPDFDLQLPEQSIENYECPVLVEPEPEIKEFKEKTVENLDTFEESGSFKKRKVVFGPKRNIRQRLDVD